MARVPDDEESDDGEPGDDGKPGDGGSGDSGEDDGTAEANSQSEGPKPGQMSELLRQLARGDRRGAVWGAELFPGAVIDRYELVREIGRGGFGVVWEAIDRRLGRRVAFKAVRAQGGEVHDRLEVEAETAARLSHPNIVTVFDLGSVDGKGYLILELLRGKTLGERLEGGAALPQAEALRIAVEIARGVAHAHGRGVVHRDLKPANVFLCDDGRVKVLDLGLAHAFGHVRPPGGTRGYMAPEQARGAPEDERSDVFALGVILFRMLSGQQPFVDEAALLGKRPAPVLEVEDAPELGELVARLLEKDPLRRPRDAGEVLGELEPVFSTTTAAPPSPARVRRWRSLERRAWASSFVFLAVVAGWLYWKRTGHAPSVVEGPLPPGSTAAETPGQRTVLAVADLDNQSGDPELDPLPRLLAASLEQSPRLSVVPRGRLLDILRLASNEAGPVRLDERSAREAARRAGVTRLLLSTIYRFGARYRFELTAVEPSGDRPILSFKEGADRKEALPEMIDRLAAEIRRSLGEAGESLQTSTMATRAVTPSLAALQSYAAGLDCVADRAFAGTFEDCLEEFDLAVARDPGFALAHYQRSRMLDLQGMSRLLQKEALDVALRFIDRVPPSNRTEVRAWAAYLDGKEVEAKRLALEAAEASPDDKWLWWLAAEIPYRRDELAEAAPLFARVHALDPTLVVPAVHLIYSLGSIGDLDGIRRLIERLKASSPRPATLLAECQGYLWVQPAKAVAACDGAVRSGGAPVADGYLAMALLTVGQRERLEEHLRRMEAASGPLSFAWFMRLLLEGQEGRWDDFARRAASARATQYFWLHAVLAEAWLGKGDTELAWRSAQRALRIDSAQANHLAVHFAYAGDLAHAAELAPYLPPDSPRQAAYRAVVRWKEGDLAGAIPELERLARSSMLSTDPAIPFPGFLYAEALAEGGRHAEAAAAYERFLAMPLRYPSWQVPRALLGLARSREAMGDRAGARRAASRLLSLWRHASPDQPLRIEALALGARLGMGVP